MFDGLEATNYVWFQIKEEKANTSVKPVDYSTLLILTFWVQTVCASKYENWLFSLHLKKLCQHQTFFVSQQTWF